MRIVTTMTLLFRLGVLCAAGIVACSSDEEAGPVGPSPTTAMSEAAPASDSYVGPGRTPNMAGGTTAETESGKTEGTWQESVGDGGIRNVGSSTTRTNWLSASPSTVTPGNEVRTLRETSFPSAGLLVILEV